MSSKSIKEMSLESIEEYLKDYTDEDTNLYMRCLECDNYISICNMNVNLEICNECESEHNN